MNEHPGDPYTLTAPETARLAGVTPATVYRWARAGAIDCRLTQISPMQEALRFHNPPRMTDGTPIIPRSTR